MCIQLTQGGKIVIPGSIAVVKVNGAFKAAQWGADQSNNVVNARVESWKTVWAPKGFVPGSIEIQSFVEGNTQFAFKKPKHIGVLVKENRFVVVTEPSTKQVQRVHARQPCWIRLLELLAA